MNNQPQGIHAIAKDLQRKMATLIEGETGARGIEVTLRGEGVWTISGSPAEVDKAVAWMLKSQAFAPDVPHGVSPLYLLEEEGFATQAYYYLKEVAR